MTVSNLRNDKGNTVANQFVITDGLQTTFQSYDSTIVTIDRLNDEIVFNGNMWDYSNTTRKHFYNFMREYIPCDIDRKTTENMLKSGKFYQWNVKQI